MIENRLRAELSDNVENDNGSDKRKRGNEDGRRSNLKSRRIVRVELKDVVTSLSAAASSGSGACCCSSLGCLNSNRDKRNEKDFE